IDQIVVQAVPLTTDAGVPSSRARADASGHCHLTHLVAEQPYRLELLAQKRRSRRWPDELTFAPGEHRSLAWPLDDGCRIDGFARDERGAPVPRLELTLTPSMRHPS